MHYGPTLVKFFSKAVKLLFLNSFIIWECNKESLLFAVWCTHSLEHAHTQRPAFLLLSMTYYCPLVVHEFAAPFLFQQLSTLELTWNPRAFVSLCLCGLFFCFLPYHTQTFKELICLIVWQRVPIMHRCVHTGFTLNGGLEQCQQKQEPWCFVAIVGPEPVSIRHCSV